MERGLPPSAGSLAPNGWLHTPPRDRFAETSFNAMAFADFDGNDGVECEHQLSRRNMRVSINDKSSMEPA